MMDSRKSITVHLNGPKWKQIFFNYPSNQKSSFSSPLSQIVCTDPVRYDKIKKGDYGSAQISVVNRFPF